MRTNQQNSFFNRPSSPIAVSEGFDWEYSEDEQENNNNDEDDENDRAIAVLADEKFLEKELLFDSDSSSNLSLDKSRVDLNSDSESATMSNNSSTFYTSATNRQPAYHTPMNFSSSSSYAQEKLVQILNRDIPMPKQQ